MASRKVDIQISTRADTTGAKQAEKAIDAVAASTTRAETASTAAVAASTKQAAGTSRVGQVASAAGFQVQDFAVQVAGGTSALVAMSQQAPQFLGVFGPGGAIAGALIAVGAIAAKVFIGMQDGAASTISSAETLAEAIEQIGKNAEKAVKKEADFGLAQIEAAKASADNLITAFDGVTDAANAASLASLANAEKIREAEIEIRRLRGEQVNELENIIANTEAEAAIREEQARQELESFREREAQAKQALVNQQAYNQDLEAQKALKEADLATEDKRLAQLREQRDILKEIAEKGYFEVTPQDVATLGMAPGTTSTQARDEASRRLENDIAPQIARIEGTINGLESEISSLTQNMADSLEAMQELAISANAISQEFAIAAPRIAEALNTTNIVAQIEGIKDIATQSATEIQNIVDTVKPTNELERAAIESLKADASDRQIQVNETARVAQNLAAIRSLINTQMGTAAANTDKLIQTISTMQQRLDAQQRQIGQLQSSARGSGN
jgi:chromosome segregation ATPase